MNETPSNADSRGERWCAFATRRRVPLHAGLFCLVAASIVCLARSPLETDWLRLFRKADPVLGTYLRYAGTEENARRLYVRVPPDAADAAAIAALRAVPGVGQVEPMTPPGEDAHAPVWLLAVMKDDNGPQERARIRAAIAACLRGAAPGAEVTGAEQVLYEFRESVNRDFIKASALSLALVGVVLAGAFGLTRALSLGLVYELAGLCIGLALSVTISGPLNMLSAALPCVLIGLGADFIIHILAASAPDDTREPGTRAGVAYRTVGRPMFWAALTTSAGFFSLALADLGGLRSVGVVGGVCVLTMFAVCLAFLPPAAERCPTPVRLRIHPRWIPEKGSNRVAWATVFALLCLGAGLFMGRLRSEQQLENLYDPRMPSLRLQRELAARLQVYPSLLFLAAETDSPEAAAEALFAGSPPYVIDPARIRVSVTDGRQQLVIPVLSRGNPFEPATHAGLSGAIGERLARVGIRDFVLTGDAVVSLHLNRLLQRGMLWALGAVTAVLTVVLAGFLKSRRYVLAPMATLAVCLTGTLGTMALAGITLSAYTLTLIPLFLGIGIDDLVYVSHALHSGRRVRPGSSLVAAITLTTATTVLGYGSLLVAGNTGFRAMGKTAVIGLLIMYAGATLLLPALLPEGNRETRPGSPGRDPETG